MALCCNRCAMLSSQLHILSSAIFVVNSTVFVVCRFHPDDIQKFINFPSKTTVGTAPKFTMNRKFFANMLSSAGFKQMVEEDEEALKKDLIKKLKYCDEATMDKELLKDFYDREVDQSKI